MTTFYGTNHTWPVDGQAKTRGSPSIFTVSCSPSIFWTVANSRLATRRLRSGAVNWMRSPWENSRSCSR